MRASLSQGMHVQTRASQQIILAGEMLEAGTAELEALLRREMADNPALELRGELQLARLRSRLRSDTGRGYSFAQPLDDLEERLPAGQPALEQLAAQLALLARPQERRPALLLLYSLDEHGYLRREPGELAAELGLGLEEVERLVSLLHSLEPAGIGARCLRECLVLQCRALAEDGLDCAIPLRILQEAWEDLAAGRWQSIARRLRLEPAAVEAARRFITGRLSPHPLRLVPDRADGPDLLGPPDLIIRRQVQGDPAQYAVEIPGAEAFELRISAAFNRALAVMPESPQKDWTRAQIERARLAIHSLGQRWTTLERIASFLIEYQSAYLAQGKAQLRPLTRSAVAAALGLHESTVSRAVAGKVAQLPNGRLAPLSEFFDQSLPLKEALLQLVDETDAALSDRQLAELLAARGLPVARRTVAKYRSQLRLPGSHHRQGAAGQRTIDHAAL